MAWLLSFKLGTHIADYYWEMAGPISFELDTSIMHTMIHIPAGTVSSTMTCVFKLSKFNSIMHIDLWKICKEFESEK